MKEQERRNYPIEFRIDSESKKIIGYASVFDQWSEDLGYFREKVARGAFKKTIKEADVRALFNHDPNFVLGRNKAGTLELEEDDKGLKIEIDPPDTQWARDLLVSMNRGDINQMSFGFETIKEKWDESDKKEIKRELLEVKLFDVSPVTYPAYPQTSAQVRSKVEELRKPLEEPTCKQLTPKDEKPPFSAHFIRRKRLALKVIGDK